MKPLSDAEQPERQPEGGKYLPVFSLRSFDFCFCCRFLWQQNLPNVYIQRNGHMLTVNPAVVRGTSVWMDGDRILDLDRRPGPGAVAEKRLWEMKIHRLFGREEVTEERMNLLEKPEGSQRKKVVLKYGHS